jgi:hypothetical protein
MNRINNSYSHVIPYAEPGRFISNAIWLTKHLKSSCSRDMARGRKLQQGKSGVRAKMEHGAALREMTPSDTDGTRHQEFRSVRRRSPPANIIRCKIHALCTRFIRRQHPFLCTVSVNVINLRSGYRVTNQFCRDRRRYRMVHVV